MFASAASHAANAASGQDPSLPELPLIRTSPPLPVPDPMTAAPADYAMHVFEKYICAAEVSAGLAWGEISSSSTSSYPNQLQQASICLATSTELEPLVSAIDLPIADAAKIAAAVGSIPNSPTKFEHDMWGQEAQLAHAEHKHKILLDQVQLVLAKTQRLVSGAAFPGPTDAAGTLNPTEQRFTSGMQCQDNVPGALQPLQSCRDYAVTGPHDLEVAAGPSFGTAYVRPLQLGSRGTSSSGGDAKSGRFRASDGGTRGRPSISTSNFSGSGRGRERLSSSTDRDNSSDGFMELGTPVERLQRGLEPQLVGSGDLRKLQLMQLVEEEQHHASQAAARRSSHSGKRKTEEMRWRHSDVDSLAAADAYAEWYKVRPPRGSGGGGVRNSLEPGERRKSRASSSGGGGKQALDLTWRSHAASGGKKGAQKGRRASASQAGQALSYGVAGGVNNTPFPWVAAPVQPVCCPARVSSGGSKVELSVATRVQEGVPGALSVGPGRSAAAAGAVSGSGVGAAVLPGQGPGMAAAQSFGSGWRPAAGPHTNSIAAATPADDDYPLMMAAAGTWGGGTAATIAAGRAGAGAGEGAAAGCLGYHGQRSGALQSFDLDECGVAATRGRRQRVAPKRYQDMDWSE
jgi:hypothetical protein